MDTPRLILSVLYVSAGLLTFFTSDHTAYLFYVVAGLTAVSMFVRLRQSRRLTLSLVWETGFLLIIVNEVYLGLTTSGAEFNADIFSRALQALALGHALVVVTCDLCGGRGKVGETTGFAWNPSLGAVALVTGVALWYVLPQGIAALHGGRSSIDSDVSGPVAALAGSAGMLAPGLIALQTKALPRFRVAVAYAVASPILFAQFAIGTRYVLLVSAISPMLVIFGPSLSNKRMALRIGLVASILFGAFTAMLTFRTTGLENTPTKGAGSGGLLSNEGILVSVMRLISYYDSTPHLHGSSALSVLLFPLPRSIWPEKPTLIGYWFPREYGLGGFGETHSISLAYVGDGYADFGMIGVAAYCVCFGFLLGFGQRYVDRAFRTASAPQSVLAASILSITAFAVRSPITTLISVCGFMFWMTVVRHLSAQERTRSPVPLHRKHASNS